MAYNFWLRSTSVITRRAIDLKQRDTSRVSLHRRNSCEQPSYFFSFHAYSRATRVSRDARHARRNRAYCSDRQREKGVLVFTIVAVVVVVESYIASPIFFLQFLILTTAFSNLQIVLSFLFYLETFEENSFPF